METKPIGSSELKGTLSKWLEEVNSKCACAVGIKNFTKDHWFENPRVWISNGKVYQKPCDKVDSNMSGGCLFIKKDLALKGTSGVVCYDISDTNLMISVMWHVPFSETLSENHFNLRVLERAECNEQLFKTVSENCKTADGELIREENGYRLCGCMSRDSKALLILDCYTAGQVGTHSIAEPTKCGKELERRLSDWLGETDVKCVCGVGLNNFTSSQLINCKVYVESGRSVIEPPTLVDPQSAAPSLFCKRKYSLKGTSGVCTYEIKDTSNMVAIIWMIPYSETLADNRFNFCVMPKTDCNGELYKKLYPEMRYAKDGEVERNDFGYSLVGRMETASKALFIVTVRNVKKSWSLW